jgi:hypothetical protein
MMSIDNSALIRGEMVDKSPLGAEKTGEDGVGVTRCFIQGRF